MTPKMKMIAAAVLLAVWGALVALKLSPAADYVTGIRDALMALGVFTVAMTNPKE